MRAGKTRWVWVFRLLVALATNLPRPGIRCEVALLFRVPLRFTNGTDASP